MKRWRKFWKTGLQLGVCAILLLWIFQAIFYNEAQIIARRTGSSWEGLSRIQRWHEAWAKGPPGLWETMRTIDLGYLCLSLFLMGLILLLGVVRWQLVLRVQQLDLPFRRTAKISIIAHFFNSFLLGSVGGDVLKAYYAARETHHKKTEAVITVLVDRLLGLFGMLVFACVMMVPNRELLTRNPRLKLLAGTVMGMTFCSGLAVTLSFWGGLSRGVPRARQWMRKLPKGELLERAIEACRHYGRDRNFLFQTMLISLALNVVCVLHFMSLTRGFHLKDSPVALSAIVPMVTSIATLPISPGGLGVRENLYVYTLPPIGIDPGQALLLSLIGYGGSLFWSAIGGLVYATQREREHLAEIAASPTGD